MIQVQQNISLAPYTTFGIGGPADYFCIVHDGPEIVEAMTYAHENKLPLFVLGGGSNVLFSDKGFRGMVMKLENTKIAVHDHVMIVGSGASLATVINTAIQNSLAGLERMAGIPGTVGGAVRGNAGAFGVEIEQYVTKVLAIDIKNAALVEFDHNDCSFSYRSSFFKKHSNMLVVSIELTLTEGDVSVLSGIAQETIQQRESKHPQTVKCAGSFFMNPYVTNSKLLKEFEDETHAPSKDGKLPAGWLIDHVGLRGKKIGGAMVSDIHPNYILNTGNATAEDIVILSSLIKQQVRSQLGIRLREEPQLVGF